MYDVVCTDADGERRQVRPVVLTPRHGEDVGPGRVTREQLAEMHQLLVEGELPDLVDTWPDDVRGALLEHVIRDALASDFVLGTSPETWSPAGDVVAGEIGRVLGGPDVPGDPDDQPLGPSPVRFHGFTDAASAVFTLVTDDGEVEAAFVVAHDAFVAAVPGGTVEIAVGLEPETADEAREDEAARALLLGLVPAGEVEQVLVWRSYSGTNTIAVDGAADEPGPVKRLARRAGLRGLALTARALWAVHRKRGDADVRHDPLAARRLRSAEFADQYLARQCPDVRVVAPGLDVVAVAVHGTMSTAMPLARALRDVLPPGLPVLRYEHDTWPPIGRSADELVGEIVRLRAKEVLLVGHSRGGLVAHAAAARLRQEKVRVRVVTLGTPFLGTPLVELAETTLWATRTLLGGLRALPGMPVVDVATRLLGFLVRGPLPRGLSDMGEKAGYVAGLAATDLSDVTRVAGHVDHDGPDAYGPTAPGVLASEVFGDALNDLVVPWVSASASRLDVHVTARSEGGIYHVVSDHFSLALAPGARRAITTVAARLPAYFATPALDGGSV